MRTITARTAAPGLHHWPDAPPHRAYLAAPHRHLFKAAVTVRVDHDNRDVEFHDLADDLLGALIDQGSPGEGILVDFGPQSCETLAAGIADALMARYNLTSIVVSEDGESDATWSP